MKVRQALLPFVLAVAAVPVAAEVPSWCSAADLGASERAICSDPTLGLLDRRLTLAYERARRVEDDLDQERWLANRDACGWDVTCLEYSYRGRIAELRAIARSAGGTVRGDGAGDAAGVAAGDGRRDEIGVSPLPRRPQDESPVAGTAPSRPGNAGPELAEAVTGGGGFDPATAALPMLDEMTPRPWCEADRLNPTERSICASRGLSRFDALLELVYGRAKARDADRAQVDWLRLERDACGTEILCIATAYAERIEALNAPFAREVERRHDVDVPPGHLPPPGWCRIWYPERPPGRQPAPTSCDVAVPAGAILIRG